MPPVTDQQLTDAATDAANFALVVNGDANAPDVVMRSGTVVKTIAKVAATVQKGDPGTPGGPGPVSYKALATALARVPAGTLANLYNVAATAQNTAYNSGAQSVNTNAYGLQLSNPFAVIAGGQFAINAAIFTDGGAYGVSYFDGNDAHVVTDTTAYVAATNVVTVPNNNNIVFARLATYYTNSQHQSDPNTIMIVLGATIPQSYVGFSTYAASQINALLANKLSIADSAALGLIIPISGLNQLFNLAALDLTPNMAYHVGGVSAGQMQNAGGFTVAGKTYMKPGATYTTNVQMFGDNDSFGRSYEDLHGNILAYTFANLAAGGTDTAPNTPGIVCMRFTITPGNDLTKVMVNFGNVALPLESFGTYSKVTIDNKITTASFPAPYRAPRRLGLKPADVVVMLNDSMSSTLYPWYRQALIDLTGANVFNDGIPGQNTATFASDAQLAVVYPRNPRLVIILIGGNDSGAPGSVGTFNGSVVGENVQPQTDITQNYYIGSGGQDGSGYQGNTFIQALDHLTRKIKAHYVNPRAAAALTGSEDEPTKNAKIAAIPNPMIVLCTTLPQNRNNAQDPSTIPANRRRLAQATIEVGIRNQIHTVDLNAMVAFDMSVEPFYGSAGNPGNPVTINNGVNTLDGLHMNQFGARRIAEHIVADTGQ